MSLFLAPPFLTKPASEFSGTLLGFDDYVSKCRSSHLPAVQP